VHEGFYEGTAGEGFGVGYVDEDEAEGSSGTEKLQFCEGASGGEAVGTSFVGGDAGVVDSGIFEGDIEEIDWFGGW